MAGFTSSHFVLLLAVATSLGCTRSSQRPATTDATPRESNEIAPPASSSVPTPSASAAAAAPAQAEKTLMERYGQGRVQSVDPRHFWIASGGRAYVTHDGGATFSDKTPFTPSEEEAVDYVFASSATRVYVLRAAPEEATDLSLFVSDDDGEHFVERRVVRGQAGRGGRLQAGPKDSILLLLGDDNGMNSHAELILTSSDGGSSFQRVGTKTGYGVITFQSAKDWWSVGTCCASADSIYRSKDAGKTWKRVSEGVEAHHAESPVWFQDSKQGYYLEASEKGLSIQTTNDGGKSFRSNKIEPPAQEIAFTSEWGIAVTDKSSLRLSTDRGVTWSNPLGLPAQKNVASSWPGGVQLVRVPLPVKDGVLIGRDGKLWQELELQAD